MVIVPSSGDDDDPWFADNPGDAYLAVNPLKGAFESVRNLMIQFQGQVHIISKAGITMELRTRRWLNEYDFFSLIKLPPENIWFCRDKIGKLEICKKLGVTHFVDDRIHVLQLLEGEVENLYLFGESSSKDIDSQRWYFVNSWPDVIQLLKKSL